MNFGTTLKSFEEFNYRLMFFYSSIISASLYGQLVTIDWLVLDLTGSAKALGVILGIQMAPYIFLSPLAGLAADHFDKRRILLVTCVLNTLLSLAFFQLYRTGNLDFYLLAILSAIFGCVNAIEGPTRTSFSMELVKHENQINAVALNAITYNIGRLIGPVLAGILIAKINNGVPFVFFAAIFIVVGISLIFIRRNEILRHEFNVVEPTNLGLAWNYLKRHPQFFIPMLLTSTFYGLGMTFAMYGSLMVKNVFLLDASFLGFLTASLAFGSIIGAALVAKRSLPGSQPKLEVMLKLGILLGFFWVSSAFMPNFWTFTFIATIGSVFHLALMATCNSLVIGCAPPGYLGRIYGIYLMFFSSGAAIGGPLIGLFAQHFGVRAAIFTSGAIVSALSLAFYLRENAHSSQERQGD
jgi:MFS family permease